jgi:hypothetical protein
MPCPYPEHHSSGSGGGFPWALAVIVAGVVVLGTSATFARDMNDVKVIILALCALVAVLGLGALALVLHHQRAPGRPAVPRPVYARSRLEPRVKRHPRELGTTVVAKVLPDGSQTPREVAAALLASRPARAGITRPGGERDG